MGRMLDFNIAELTQLTNRLNATALSAADENQLLKDLGAEVETQTRERFDTKIAPDGSPWAALAASTTKYLQKHFPSAQPPLVRTGELRDSTEFQISGSTVNIGQTKYYAKYLQDGTKKGGSVKIPARPSLGLGANDVAELGAITESFLERILA